MSKVDDLGISSWYLDLFNKGKKLMSGSGGVYQTLVPFPTDPKEPKNWWAGQSPATSSSGLRCRPSLAGNTPPRVLRTQCAISQMNKLIQYPIPLQRQTEDMF